jgi:ABC-type transport system substrate-binding protein
VHFKLGASWGYGANDKTDQYIKQITTEIDPEKRVRLEREFERYIQEVWVPWVWLWHQESIYGVANDLMWTPQPDEKIWFTDMQRK